VPAIRKTTKKARRQPNAVERSDIYEKFYATNVLVWTTESDIRFDTFNERLPHSRHFDYTADVGVILTPEAAVILKDHLVAAIAEFEKAHGVVSVRDERRRALESLHVGHLPSD
jgi:hypothetical protein